MIPLYILGVLSRYGPQHGYQIKKMLAEQMADFTDIKLPTIYYHLGKLEGSGLVEGSEAKEKKRPEKRVYRITELGVTRFGTLLDQALGTEYRPTFDIDGALFFDDHLKPDDLKSALTQRVADMTVALEHICSHREQVLVTVPEPMRNTAALIFSHHELHYRAELDWARQGLTNMEDEHNDETTDN